MIYELGAEEARTLLARETFAHLGCVVEGFPYVVPLHYVVDGGFAYAHSGEGRKLEGMRAYPWVCLQVERVDSEYHWRSVQAFGTFEEIDDETERERVFSMLFARFPRLTPADSVRRTGHLDATPIAFRVRLERVVGVGEGEREP